ncbi:MAG TPA: ELWxxDGT repeat protein [Thermoanaerobaculia bacterium]|nr:ELWxxDGT repeat protein [Thermoanaerobaculia bacterium]
MASAETALAQARRLTRLQTAPAPGYVIVAAPPALVGETLFFPTWDEKNSHAMRASDGSSPRATVLRGGWSQTAVAFGGRAFFIGIDATSSRLWVSDGFPDGTTPVAELAGPAAASLTAADGALYLRSGDAHPWRSDGTAAGTLLLSDDAILSDTPAFTAWNGAVYFLASSRDGRLGLWSTAGSPATTRRVADLGAGVDTGRFAYGLTALGERLYFYTSEDAFGTRYRLWSFDGNVAGAAVVHEFFGTAGPVCPGTCFGIGPETLAVLGDLLVFVADDGAHGREPWRTDGTAAGTEILADIAPGPAKSIVASFMDPLLSAHTDSFAVFSADDGVHGAEPWITDGTPQGTRLLVDIGAGPEGSAPFGFVGVGGAIYFTAADAIRRTDGTSAGTTVFRPGGALLYPVDGGFAVVDAAGLHLSDGASLTLVDDLTGVPGLGPIGLTPFGGGIEFSRLDGDDTLHDLWRFDIANATAGVLHHFASFSILPSAVAGALWMGADDGVHGVEPWVSDGTVEGTRLLRDIATDGDSAPGLFTAVNSRVFFTASDVAHGVELWESDGSDAGTHMVEDLQPGEFGSAPSDLTPFQGALMFSTFLPTGLWSTDGTEPGTRSIASISASWLVVAGDLLYFIGQQDATGSELWSSDGTGAGTRLVKDTVPGPGSENHYSLIAAGHRIFYIGETSAGPNEIYELWTSDGTEAGTAPLAAFRLILELTAVGGNIFFEADDGEHGFELWTSDGTPGGTRLVRDIAPGPASSFPSRLAAVAGRLYFAADDGVHGVEPWVSDGTEAGTHLVEDLAPGPASSSPSQFRQSGDTVYFRASDDEAGAQIWSMPADADGSVRPRGRPRDPRVVPPRN